MTAARTAHPSKYPKYALDRLAIYIRAEARSLGRPARVLDPMAGVGRIHDLPRRHADTVGVEIEPEWAACRERTHVGDATALPAGWTASFHVVAVSPSYGNRLADHHDAKDACHACDGTGVTLTSTGCGDAPMFCPACHAASCACGVLAKTLREHNRSCPTCRSHVCETCGGQGVSRRYTYRHALGRMPTAGSSATLNWTEQGGLYRALHREAWSEAARVLVPGGLMLLNCKNHIRSGEEQPVVEWHARCLTEVGFTVDHVDHLPAPGIRHGANSEVRVDHERIIVARRDV